jgi:hypothetical protein
LTGNPSAAYSDVFQIRDPARRMFVPKSQYLRLSTRWQACVAIGGVKRTPLAHAVAASAAPAGAAAAPAAAAEAPVGAPEAPVGAPEASMGAITGPAITSAPQAVGTTSPAPALSDGSRDDFVVIATIASSALLVLLIYAAGDSLARRPIPPVMQRAGEQFVTAFARPLIDPSSSVPPIQVQLRFIRRAQQLEISIAPGAGRRYPNLVDHKRNVAYDVNRVMRVLGNHFVVSDRLRAAGKWVVVPIRLADVKQTGAK